MSTVTVVPTLEAGNVPQRVRLNVTDTGTPSLFAATVTRLNPDGSVGIVRTLDGNPLTLTTSGTDRVGLLYDYEVPFGAPVSYSTLESPGVISAEVTVAESRVWLIHPGVPTLSQPIELRMGSFEEEEWSVQEGVFYPMGREFPVVQTDGARKAGGSSFTVAVSSLTQLASLRALLRDASPLLLNVPSNLGLGVDTSYIAVGNVRNARLSDIGTDAHRDLTLTYRVVDRPVGGSQSERTYVDLLDFASYSDLLSAYATYNDLLAGP